MTNTELQLVIINKILKICTIHNTYIHVAISVDVLLSVENAWFFEIISCDVCACEILANEENK